MGRNETDFGQVKPDGKLELTDSGQKEKEEQESIGRRWKVRGRHQLYWPVEIKD